MHYLVYSRLTIRNELTVVYFKMRADDFRLKSPEFGYTIVSELKSTSVKMKSSNGRTVTIHVDRNNDQWAVFSDWSAKSIHNLNN